MRHGSLPISYLVSFNTMVIKESSDDLNEPVVTTGVGVASPVSKRSFKDYLAFVIATCGVGYLPIAPGTWGSVVGVGLHLFWVILIYRLIESKYLSSIGGGHWPTLGVDCLLSVMTLALVFVLTMGGIWAATRVEKVSGRKDASIIVIDEVVGQFITLMFLPFFVSGNWEFMLAGFLLFRLFDIWKPYPIRRLESLESGLGVMADDVLAGVYAGTVLLLFTGIYSLVRREG